MAASYCIWPGQGSVLAGILLENYHYVRAASVRQSPLLSHGMTAAQFELIREFVTGEAAHEAFFIDSLARWGMDL
jgi:hypothetical protein